MGERAVLQEDPVLVAPQPRQDVAPPYPRAQNGGHLLEHLVALEMAAGVVDHFELVEIHVEEDVLALFGAGAPDRPFQADLELAPVDEAGQRVVAREVDHLALHAAQLSDVLEDQDGADQLALPVADGSRRVAHGEFPPVEADEESVPGRFDDAPLLEAALDRIGEGPPGHLVDDLEDLGDRRPAGALGGPAGQPLGHRVDVVDEAVGIAPYHPVPDRGEGDLGALLFPVEGLLGVLSFGDVQGEAHTAGDPPLGVDQGLDLGLKEPPVPLVLEGDRLPGEGQGVGAKDRELGVAGAEVVVEGAGALDVRPHPAELARGAALAEVRNPAAGDGEKRAGISKQAQLTVGGPDQGRHGAGQPAQAVLLLASLRFAQATGA